MKEARYFYVPGAAEAHELPAEEAQHALRVLRLQPGDELFLMDGQGTFYRAEVALATSKRCMYVIKEVLPQEKTWHGCIHLAIAPTKMMERIEWLLEKATEVGADEFSFLDCKFSERKVVNLQRLNKIVVSAMKQSRKPWKPVVNEMAGFKAFVSEPRRGRKFIAHCYEEFEKRDFFESLGQLPADEEVTVLVGPEGDFSADEVQMAMSQGYEPISLGKSRLRTETAGLMAVIMSMLAKRKTGC